MRKSGILMHISSLPGAGGIGSLGKEAYAFADFLEASGMKLWQVLPMGPATANLLTSLPASTRAIRC